MTITTHTNILDTARSVIHIEIQALQAMQDKIDIHFEKTCMLMLNCPGRIIVTGMGKSGHIAQKIAATLASTGTPAFFIHPGEAAHGDIGMITCQDIIIMLSNSGETEEIIALIPRLQALPVPIIAMTGRFNSTLARAAHLCLNTAAPKEACPLGLAPTASTTNCLVLGDALAISLLKKRGFTREDFAKAHPGGQLGKRLLTRVQDLMHTDSAIPTVPQHYTVAQALLEMTSKRFGMTCVKDTHTHALLGVFTDGDLRRTLDHGIDLHATQISEVMTASALSTPPHTLAIDALKMMRKHRITSLIIATLDDSIAGIVHLHDLLSIGMDTAHETATT